MLETIPFPPTSERRAFACACLPFYEQFYPTVLQELHGIADGQSCNFEDLCCVLFSMYCILPQADTHTTMGPHNRLPQDTWQTPERYDTLKSFFTAHPGNLTPSHAKALLADKDTVWSVLYAPQQKQIWRAQGYPARLPFVKDSRPLF